MKRTSIFILLFSLLFAFEMQAQNTLRLNSAQRLDKGQKIEVAGKGYLTLQTDGNLVAYDAANAPKWATGTSGKAVTHVIMQTDGNLVIYNNSTPAWASDTWNQANGGYFETDLTSWQVAIFKSNGTVAKVLQQATGAVNVQVDPLTVNQTTPITTTIIATGTITLSDPPLPFPRQQGWESKMCSAIGMTGVAATYAGLTDFQKAIGDMALKAAEAYFPASGQRNITVQQVIDKLKGEMLATPVRDTLIGLIGIQVIDKLKLHQNDVQSIALRDWATQVYRQMKVDAAIGTLKDYYIWKNNPCAYSAEGYQKPQDCHAVVGNIPYNSMWKTNKPPSDLLAKAGLVYAAGNNGRIVKGVSVAIGTVGFVAGFAATATGLGVSVLVPGAEAVYVMTNLGSAFITLGGQTSPTLAAGAGIGATSWAGVVAGPAAVIVSAAMIGVTQGAAVIEGEQAEWRLKQAIHVAMKENLNMANVVAEKNAGALFLIGLVKSAQNGWKPPTLEIEGEVTFFCEAGYISKFTLTYTLNGQAKSFSTSYLPAGLWQKFTIPAAAKNIEVKGVMISAGEQQVFKETLQRPTYVCYKVYGTVFQQAWNNDWPLSVGGEVSDMANKVKFFHQAGYVANFLITYNEPGKATATTHNPLGKTAGWTETYTIPANATNVRVLIQGGTGLAWEPWRTTYDLTFPTPPNMCIKIYGTSLDQKWNSDCN